MQLEFDGLDGRYGGCAGGGWWTVVGAVPAIFATIQLPAISPTSTSLVESGPYSDASSQENIEGDASIEQDAPTPIPNPESYLSLAEERQLISLLYRRLGASNPEEWDGRDGTVSKIISEANFSRNQRDKIRDVIKRTWQSLRAGTEYDPRTTRNGREENSNAHAIKEGSRVHGLVAHYLKTGMSYPDMTTYINEICVAEGQPTATRSAIYSCS